jgi:hypothetical protein
MEYMVHSTQLHNCQWQVIQLSQRMAVNLIPVVDIAQTHLTESGVPP